jgi:ppGpp synthetase/RelA/SpoT-type nucleotidyltranferase
MIQWYTPQVELEENLASMEWAKPLYSHKEVDQAGEILVRGNPKGKELVHALDVVDNFRSAHAFPLNTLQVNLRGHSKVIDAESIIAQRLKRLFSILLKLDRFQTMRLWEMQDIGGCRAIVHTVDQVNQLASIYTGGSTRIRHKLVGQKNYILQPKRDGYRSRHLIYRYVSDKNKIYNNLKIEIQIRTILEHAWATAVETVDAFTKQALKSSRGSEDWKRFFQLMGTEIAFREKSPLVLGISKDRERWIKELKVCATTLQVRNTLLGFANALRAAIPTKDSQYFLLSLDEKAEQLSITGYNQKELTRASKAYAAREKSIREHKAGDAVLVSVESLGDLKRAYPNYFADTAIFISILDECMKE